MNRAERRRGKWAKLNPHLDYDELAKLGDAGRKVAMFALRELVGADAPFDDRTLWNSIRELINAGLLNVWIRSGADGVEIRPELIIPNDQPKRDEA